MPRYLIERTFQEGFALPNPSNSEQARRRFIENNALMGVFWIHSYVSPDRKRSYCIYDSPGPEALRRTAQMNGLPIDRIIEVSVLDPYFFAV